MAEARREVWGDIDRLELDYKVDPGRFVPLAQAYLARNLPNQAIQVCREGLSRNPQVADGQLALAMAYYHNYDDTQAEIHLQRVLQSAPNNWIARRTLGEIYLERKQEQKAIAELVKALEIQPADRHTRGLLESLGEKVNVHRSENGKPHTPWLSRQVYVPKLPPRPLWRIAAQLGIVTVAVVVLVLWYRHAVNVRQEVRTLLLESQKVVQPDNADDLINAEKKIAAAFALDDSEERTVLYAVQTESELVEDHGFTDRIPKLKQHLAWLKDEELQYSERYATEGFLLFQEGKVEEAIKLLSGVIDRAIEKKDILLSAMVFGVRGSAYLAQGKNSEALEDYNRASRFTSLSPRYQAKVGETYLRDGNLPRAIRTFSEALRRNSDHAASTIRRAFATILTGRNLAQAKTDLENISKRLDSEELSDPLRSGYHVARGELALLDPAEGADRALDEAQKAVAKWPKDAEAYDLKGRALAAKGDAAGAVAALNQAVELDPRLPRLFFHRAETMFTLGQKQESYDLLRDFERTMKPTVPYVVLRGRLLLQQEQLDQALAEFESAIKLDELNPLGRHWKAVAYKTMADKIEPKKENEERRRELYNKARESFQDATILPGGETAEVYLEMGRIYLASQDFDNALDNFGKAGMMMTKASEPPAKIAALYVDISKVFKEMGGKEGERMQQSYLRRAKGLEEGKSLDQVEREEAELEKSKTGRGRRAG